VAHNTAAEDGGGFAFALAGCRGFGGNPQVTNATITANSADTGGGLAVVGGKTVVDVAFATIEGNTARVASFGGGIALQDYGLPVDHDKVNLKTSILAKNSDTASLANCSQAAQVVSGGDNLEDGTTCGFTPAKHDHSSVDPKLGPLAANGGFSQTEALLTGSPAIDAVTAGNCTDGKTPAAPVTTDQRHLTRPGGTACDIGAFEVQPAAGGTQGVGTPTTGGPIAVPNTGGALSLTPALPLTAGGLLLLGLVRRRGQRR